MKKRLTIKWNAPVVLVLVFISTVATILNYVTQGISNHVLFMTYHSSLLSPLTWVRAFTHIFGHADWSHLIGNMSYLLLLEPILEEKYSSRVMAEVTILTAFITSMINYIFFPQVALCGASGVVFAFILLSSFTSFKKGEIPITFILVALLFIGGQVWEAVTVKDNISNMAHIAGGIIGGAIGYGLNQKTGYGK